MLDIPDLTISPEKVWFIIAKARQVDVKDVVTDLERPSDPGDDVTMSVIEDRPDDPVRTELIGFIRDLNEDEQIDLVALAWLGRGDADLEGWGDLCAEATRAHNNRTASYLLGMPLLADYLEEGLEQFGHSCEEFEGPMT